MYIDILLGLVFFASLYILWQRIAKRIPELSAIPDKEVSVLLEENTARLHRFILHIFHFRIFYRERHYQDKFWSIAAKIIFKIHILLLRLDNGLMDVLKRIRINREGAESGSVPGDYGKHLPLPVSGEAGLPDERKNAMQEVRQRRRTEISKDRVVSAPIETSMPRPEAGFNSIASRRPAMPRRIRRDASQ
ncbi:MAG: hypothetical protein Q8R40_04675 [bacterium]|nr:hypothetical protein [bacterium]